jgi:tetratricopeptide (TPR) repeat protein
MPGVTGTGVGVAALVVLGLASACGREGRVEVPTGSFVAPLAESGPIEALQAEHAAQGDRADVAGADTALRLAEALVRAGRAGEAGPVYVAALTLYRKASSHDDPRAVYAEARLGAVLHAQGRLDEAKVAYREALAFAGKAFEPSDPRLAELEERLAQIAEAQGRLETAAEHRARALDLRSRTPGGAPRR